MARVPEGVFPRFLTDRGLDIRQPTIENQAHQVAKDVANYLASGGTITVIPPGTSGMVGEKGEYIANLGAWTTPVVQDKGEVAARKRQRTILAALSDQGYHAQWAAGFDDCWAIVENYMQLGEYKA